MALASQRDHNGAGPAETRWLVRPGRVESGVTWTRGSGHSPPPALPTSPMAATGGPTSWRYHQLIGYPWSKQPNFLTCPSVAHTPHAGLSGTPRSVKQRRGPSAPPIRRTEAISEEEAVLDILDHITPPSARYAASGASITTSALITKQSVISRLAPGTHATARIRPFPLSSASICKHRSWSVYTSRGKWTTVSDSKSTGIS